MTYLHIGHCKSTCTAYRLRRHHPVDIKYLEDIQVVEENNTMNITFHCRTDSAPLQPSFDLSKKRDNKVNSG